MWQKARVISNSIGSGKSFWVVAVPPNSQDGYPPGFISNLISPVVDDYLRWVMAGQTELLPEFAEDVPLVTWEDFLNGADTESGEKR